MVAYNLENTMSDYGKVSRGVISVDSDDNVLDIRERTFEKGDPIKPDTLVSMNCFGFTPDIFGHLGNIYDEFLKDLGDNQGAECQLSENIGQLIKEGKITLKAVRTDGLWMGVTYQQDKQDVADKIKKMVENGVYRLPLWRT